MLLCRKEHRKNHKPPLLAPGSPWCLLGAQKQGSKIPSAAGVGTLPPSRAGLKAKLSPPTTSPHGGTSGCRVKARARIRALTNREAIARVLGCCSSSRSPSPDSQHSSSWLLLQDAEGMEPLELLHGAPSSLSGLPARIQLPQHLTTSFKAPAVSLFTTC